MQRRSGGATEYDLIEADEGSVLPYEPRNLHADLFNGIELPALAYIRIEQSLKLLTDSRGIGCAKKRILQLTDERDDEIRED